MLVLTRKSGETIHIGDDIRVTVMEIKGGQVRLGIEAPRRVKVFRGEIYDMIQKENKDAAARAPSTLDLLLNIWEEEAKAPGGDKEGEE